MGAWQRRSRTFERELVVCTVKDPAYKIANGMLTVLPFGIRLLQVIPCSLLTLQPPLALTTASSSPNSTLPPLRPSGVLQCLRQMHDGRHGEGWRQPCANACKYSSSLLVQALSLLGSRSSPFQYYCWLAASIISTLFAFSWDVFVDWGLGPQPMRRAVRRVLTPSAPLGGEYEGASYWLRVVRVFPNSWCMRHQAYVPF